MKSLKAVVWRSSFLPFAALSLLFLVGPAAHAQVPTPQTGGSGQSDADAPPAETKPADTTDAKPANTTPATTPAATPAAAPATTPAASSSAAQPKKSKIPFKHTSSASKPAKAKVVKTASEEKDTSGGAEPDKVLYDRAQDDLKHGRYTEGRLALQTLVNTYPDSEYLAKAKLMVADSYYKEGGTSNLTQAIQEYKDFQTFFPFLENEASYAQMQVGLAHYHMMEKSDRDTTQAQQAEDEFQSFLIKYPQSPLVPKAEQYLRDVQEILADGEFKIAYYYYFTKQDYRASAARLVELSDRYPLYSQNDQALWMLGDIYDRARQVSKNEDDKSHWGDLAAKCYDRIVTEYPLSKTAPEAQARLKAMGKPVPAADANALVREQQQLAYEKAHRQNPIVGKGMGMIKGSPDVAVAARYGTPQMNPPDDAVSATDVLKPGAQGPTFTVTGSGRTQASADDSNGPVSVEEAAGSGHAVDPNADAQTGVGAEIITPVDDKAQPTSDAPRTPQAQVPAPSEAPPGAPSTLDNNAAAAVSGSAPSAVGTAPAPAADPSANVSTESSSGAAAGTTPGASSSSQAPASTTASPDANAAKASSAADSTGESTSKKKKGVKKILPW